MLRKFFFFGLGLSLLTCGALYWLSQSIAAFAERDERRQADAAIVLGAGVWRGNPSPVFRERINHAILLYTEGYVDKIIFTGGIGDRDILSEAEVGANYAMGRGVPAEAILMEKTSTNTIENLANARTVAQANALDNFIIVSTPYHMKRAMWIADDLGMEAYSSPTRSTRWISDRTQRRFLIQETISYVTHSMRVVFGVVPSGGAPRS